MKMNTAQQWSREEKIAYVNSHRKAVDRPKLGANISAEEIERHLNLISDNAPHGNDPWLDVEHTNNPPVTPPRTT